MVRYCDYTATKRQAELMNSPGVSQNHAPPRQKHTQKKHIPWNSSRREAPIASQGLMMKGENCQLEVQETLGVHGRTICHDYVRNGKTR